MIVNVNVCYIFMFVRSFIIVSYKRNTEVFFVVLAKAHSRFLLRSSGD